jgi:acyl-CoA thioester hydrolase
MFVNRTSIRVRYAETDQMSIVYYGNYPQYFEVGRVEALRQLGMTYKQMETDGIMLPVLKLEIKYIRPAIYDDLLTISTKISKLPNTRIQFEHEIHNEAGELLTLGQVELVFVKIDNKKPCRAPQNFLDTLAPFFNTK